VTLENEPDVRLSSEVSGRRRPPLFAWFFRCTGWRLSVPLELTEEDTMRLTFSVVLACLFPITVLAQTTAPAQEEPGVVELAASPMFPIGSVIVYAGVLDEQTAIQLDKAGWVPADGRTLPRAGKYNKLAMVLKDKYRRPGDNVVNSFRLPDLVGRAPIGASTVAPSSPTVPGNNPLGGTGGSERVAICGRSTARPSGRGQDDCCDRVLVLRGSTCAPRNRWLQSQPLGEF